MTIQEPTERGRKPPITTSGQLPPLHNLAPELHRSIGNTSRGGPNQTRTLWEWLTLDNRRPDYRARQAALALIERLCALAMQSSSLLIREEDQGVGLSKARSIWPGRSMFDERFVATALALSRLCDKLRQMPGSNRGGALSRWQMEMQAGIDGALSAIATEAGTATTENTGVVHDGPGPQDVARKDIP